MYSSLILKDSPEAIWELAETTGLTAYCDAFLNDSIYDGEYYSGKFIRSEVPIVYGGKKCIQNNGTFTDNYSTDNKMFSIPSVGKFGAQTRSRYYTLEFWLNLNFDPVSLTSGAASRIGESKIVGVSGASDSGLYIRDLDYLVFKLGDTSKQKFESSVHVPNFNSPLHIMMVYTPSSIRLMVNGVSGPETSLSSDPFGDQEERTIDFLFPDRINSSSQYFDNISYGTIAMYGDEITYDAAMRHYVYGIGYSVPRFTLKGVGGVVYDSNMQITQPLKTINYLDIDTWSNRVQLNNLIATDNGISTPQFNNHNLYISSNDSSIRRSNMFASSDGVDGLIFPENAFSYLEIDNYESITDANTKKIEAKFKLVGTHAVDEQQLFYISSKTDVEKYISATITHETIEVSYKEESGTLTSLLTHTMHTSATSFFVSIAKNGSNIEVSVYDDQNTGATGTITESFIFPLRNSYIRFGTAPIFFQEFSQPGLLPDDTKRFDGYLTQVDISEGTSATSSWSSYPTRKISSLYQLYPDYSTRSLKVATSGDFSLTLSIQDLIGNTIYDSAVSDFVDLYDLQASKIFIAPKVEIGSASSEVRYDLNSISGTTITTHQNDVDIRSVNFSGVTSTISSQQIQYSISGTVISTDTNNSPGRLQYFRIFTYPVLQETSRNYIEINDTHPGDNIKYFSGYSSSVNHPFSKLPELERTTDIYRSFNTGIPVGTHGSNNPYVKVPTNFSNSGTASTKIYEVMFTGRHVSGTSADVELFRGGAYTVNLTTPEPSGTELYINGVRFDSGETYNFSSWNHFCIKITSGIDNNTDIFFGYSGSGWNVDNIVVLTESISPQKIEELYKVYFGNPAYRAPDNQSSSLFNFILNDSQLSDGVYEYQPVMGQSSFVQRSSCPNVASNGNMPVVSVGGSNYTISYSSIDTITADNKQLVVGDVVLLKNQSTASQNGVYQVTAKTNNLLTLQKNSSVSDGSVFFVTGGNINKNCYFIKSSDSYTRTYPQKKIVAYNSGTPSITAVVNSSARA